MYVATDRKSLVLVGIHHSRRALAIAFPLTKPYVGWETNQSQQGYGAAFLASLHLSPLSVGPFKSHTSSAAGALFSINEHCRTVIPFRTKGIYMQWDSVFPFARGSGGENFIFRAEQFNLIFCKFSPRK